MNRSELIDIVARRSKLEPHTVEMVVDTMTEIIGITLSTEEEVMIRGFGKFRPIRREARPGRNPRTGEPVEIDARLSCSFIPSNILKDRLNGGSGPLSESVDGTSAVTPAHG